MRYPDGTIHFLHVGKAAGTQIQHVIEQINQSRRVKRKLVYHGHGFGLFNVPPGQDYFFSTRDPLTRFKSGFYARKRKYHVNAGHQDWTEHERRAFARFSHAKDLAEALFAPGQRGQEAVQAILSNQHCARAIVDEFKFCGHLFALRPPLWIIRQERFQADLEVFLRRIGYNGPVDVATAKEEANTGDYDGVPELSESAKANLRRWYAQDYAFLALCESWLNENESEASATR